jgi:hypothetical protein
MMWISSTAIDVYPPPGVSTARLTLQNGTQYALTSALSFSFSNPVGGDLGLDVGAEAPSTWYYMYVLPKSGSATEFTVKASATSPTNTSGPPSSSSYAYLGSFYNNSGSNIRPFDQNNSYFSYRDYTGLELVLYTESAGSPATGTWTLLSASSISSSFPTNTAGSVVITGVMDSDAAGVHEIMVEAGNPPSYTPSSFNQTFLIAQENSRCANTKIINLTLNGSSKGDISRYWLNRTGLVDIRLWVLGYYDKYLPG